MYKIYWHEYHNPLNWGKTEQAGIRNLKASLPTKKVYLDPHEHDGWVVCECELKAKTLKKAIKLAKELEGVETFSILKNNKVVFTEENLTQ